MNKKVLATRLTRNLLGFKTFCYPPSSIMHGFFASVTGPQDTVGGGALGEQGNYDQGVFYSPDPSGGKVNGMANLQNDLGLRIASRYFDAPGGCIQIGKTGGVTNHGRPTSETIDNGTPFFMLWKAARELGVYEVVLQEFPHARALVLCGPEAGAPSTIEDCQQGQEAKRRWALQNFFNPNPTSLAENPGGLGVISKMVAQRQRWGGSKEIGVDYILPDILEEIIHGKILRSIGLIPGINGRVGRSSSMTWKEIMDNLMLISWYFVGPGELGRQVSPAVFLLSNGTIKPYIADFELFTAAVALDVAGGMSSFAFSAFKGGYSPYYSLVKGPGRFAALLPAYYELFDNRYQGSAIGPFIVTALTSEGVKRSHKRMISAVRGLNKLALAYTAYKFLRYETNLLTYVYSGEQTRELVDQEGLADHPDYYDNLPLLPEDLGPTGDIIGAPAGYEELARHGTRIITPPSVVSRTSQEGFKVLGDENDFLTYSTFGNAFWVSYILLLTHYAVKWLKLTSEGVPTNAYFPYTNELEVHHNSEQLQTGKSGEVEEDGLLLEELLRAKDAATQAFEDTPLLRDGFSDTRERYGNSANLLDWQLIMEASRLASSCDVKERILGRAILRRVERTTLDKTAIYNAGKMHYQSEAVLPYIESKGIIDSATRAAEQLGSNILKYGVRERQSFLTDLLFLEGLQEEVRNPETPAPIRCQVEAIGHQVSDRIADIVDTMHSGAEDAQSSLYRLRALRDLICRIRFMPGFWKRKLVLPKRLHPIRLVKRAHKRYVSQTLRRQMKRLIKHILTTELPKAKNDQEKIHILSEVFKAQSIFNKKGIRSIWEIFLSFISLFVPFMRTPHVKRKAVIYWKIHKILETAKDKKLLERYKNFDYYEERLAFQLGIVNWLSSLCIRVRRFFYERRKVREAVHDLKVLADAKTNATSEKNNLVGLRVVVQVYDSIKTRLYQYSLRSRQGYRSGRLSSNLQDCTNFTLERIQDNRANGEVMNGEELTILEKIVHGKVSEGAVERARIPKFVISKRYAEAVADNKDNLYKNEDERRLLLQEILKTHCPLRSSKDTQRKVVAALVDIYNKKIEADRKSEGKVSDDLRKEIRVFEGIFYQNCALAGFFVKDRGIIRNNTNAYRFIYDLAPLKKEKYVRRSGVSLKRLVNGILYVFSSLIRYPLERFSFSSIENVYSLPNSRRAYKSVDDMHDRVDRVINSMSWAHRRMFRACKKAGDELLSGLMYRELDFSL